MQQDASLSVLTCPVCDGDHAICLEFDVEAGAFRMFCPEAGWTPIADADVASLRVDPSWLVDRLDDALPVLRPRLRRVLVPESAWLLGEVVCERTSIMTALACGIGGGDALDALVDALARTPPAELGIVLTTAPSLPRAPLVPRGYHVLNLREILRATPGGLEVDHRRLGEWVNGFLRNSDRPIDNKGGRPSTSVEVLTVFRARRFRGLPYGRKLPEARAIIKEWQRHYPETSPPHESTIRRHLPKPRLSVGARSS